MRRKLFAIISCAQRCVWSWRSRYLPSSSYLLNLCARHVATGPPQHSTLGRPPRQVMEASPAQTRCECVLTAEQAAPLSGRQTGREGFGKRWLANVLGLKIGGEGRRSVSDSSSSPSEQRASPDYRYTQMTAPVVEGCCF